MHATLPLLQNTDFPPIRRARLETLQVNLGYRCNQSCLHCHVDAGPRRTELMDAETVETVLAFMQASGVRRLDVTGGAPELNPHFRDLVVRVRAMGVHVVDRCNLTILEEPGQEDLAAFLAAHAVEVIASMPCYLQDNVDAQRGRGVYAKSIAALKRLNALGYGQGKGLVLGLVYNPQGASLPPEQRRLQDDYQRELQARHGIAFDRLLTIANMPIRRFGSWLVSKGRFTAYMQLLKHSYRPQNLEDVMCRSLISVDWQGHVYDCDFNQMLALPLSHGGKQGTHLRDLIGRDLEGHPIAVMDHCYGCTAGQGSSCGGALVA